MKYCVEGFDQEQMVKLGMDVIDATILRWFVDFQGSGKMAELFVEGDDRAFYWIKYDSIIADLPILRIGNKEWLGKRIKRMAVFERHTFRKASGVYAGVRLNKDTYPALVEPSKRSQKTEGSEPKVDLVVEQTEPKVGTKDPNTNLDPNTNNPAGQPKADGKIPIEQKAIDYLNEKTGRRYRLTPKHKKLIQARVKEGYERADFKKAIDNMVSAWKGTEMENYLRPETLFSAKFDSYVNHKDTNRYR